MCKHNFIDSINKKYVKDALDQMEIIPRGSWILVQVWDKNPNYDKLLKEYTKKLKVTQKKHKGCGKNSNIATKSDKTIKVMKKTKKKSNKSKLTRFQRRRRKS